MIIKGEVSNIKNNMIDELSNCFQSSFGSDLVPLELAKLLLYFTKITGREIIVFITRNGKILEAYIGDSNTVKTENLNTRNKKIRCIHTHPGYHSNLSDIDISYLNVMEIETIIAISESINKEIEVSFAYGLFDDFKEYSKLSLEKVNQMNIYSKLDKSRMHRNKINDNIDEKEKVILAGSTEKDLEELKNLAVSADAIVLDFIFYKEASNKSKYYVGSGKIQEIASLLQKSAADTVIFDDELKGSQIRNIENILNAKVLDRTMLILDIFAKRAKSKEGKLQVHLAQLNYRYTHLIGKGLQLSRLGGGIGTRGPGETKLETDRRHIKTQINNIENELLRINKTRNKHREDRSKKNLKTVALVGYTNSGKSSLLNSLTKSEVNVADMLFATLDTTTRLLDLPGGRQVLLSDTVGFINKLPHELIDAFKATLEEVVWADLILLVLDANEPNVFDHQNTTYDILEQLNVCDTPIITVLNKIDLAGNDVDRRIYIHKKYSSKYEYVSAKTGEGLNSLKASIDKIIFDSFEKVVENIEYSDAARASIIHDNYKVISEKFEENEIIIEYEKDKKGKSF